MRGPVPFRPQSLRLATEKYTENTTVSSTKTSKRATSAKGTEITPFSSMVSIYRSNTALIGAQHGLLIGRDRSSLLAKRRRCGFRFAPVHWNLADEEEVLSPGIAWVSAGSFASFVKRRLGAVRLGSEPTRRGAV